MALVRSAYVHSRQSRPFHLAPQYPISLITPCTWALPGSGLRCRYGYLVVEGIWSPRTDQTAEIEMQ